MYITNVFFHRNQITSMYNYDNISKIGELFNQKFKYL